MLALALRRAVTAARDLAREAARLRPLRPALQELRTEVERAHRTLSERPRR